MNCGSFPGRFQQLDYQYQQSIKQCILVETSVYTVPLLHFHEYKFPYLLKPILHFYSVNVWRD